MAKRYKLKKAGEKKDEQPKAIRFTGEDAEKLIYARCLIYESKVRKFI